MALNTKVPSFVLSLTYAYLLMDASATRSITQAKTDIIMTLSTGSLVVTSLRLT